MDNEFFDPKLQYVPPPILRILRLRSHWKPNQTLLPSAFLRKSKDTRRLFLRGAKEVKELGRQNQNKYVLLCARGRLNEVADVAREAESTAESWRQYGGSTGLLY